MNSGTIEWDFVTYTASFYNFKCGKYYLRFEISPRMKFSYFLQIILKSDVYLYYHIRIIGYMWNKSLCLEW